MLLFVLALIVITSAAILAFSERALNEMAGEGYYVQRTRLRGEAYSALEATLAVLADFREIDGGLFAPAQGWADPLAYAGYEAAEGREVAVEFSDENAKLPLKLADTEEAVLVALFSGLGFETKDVEVLTDSLLDWIDRDDTPRPYGAELDTYLRDDPPHLAANRAPRTFDELAGVQGFADLMFTPTGYPTAQFEEFKRRVSLHGDGSINLNTAPEEVLRLTGLFDENQVAALGMALDTVDGVRGTPGGRFYRSLRELGDQVGALPKVPVLTVRTKVLGIVVTVREGKAEFRLRAVIRTDATGKTATKAGPGTSSRVPSTRPSRGTVGKTVGVPTQVEYPFRFLELVEDPPPTSIDGLVPNP